MANQTHIAKQPDHNSLVRRIQHGDRDALAELLQHEQTRLYNTVLRMVSHRDDALELSQQAMLQIIQNIDGFEGKSAVTTWMTRIAMNLAISHLRKRRVRHAASLDAPAPNHGPTTTLAEQLPDRREPPPDHRVKQQERAAMLKRALAELEADHRAVIVLRDIDQLDYQQIAQVLSIAVGTVKSRLFRARLALRSRLVKLEHEPLPQSISPLANPTALSAESEP